MKVLKIILGQYWILNLLVLSNLSILNWERNGRVSTTVKQFIHQNFTRNLEANWKTDQISNSRKLIHRSSILSILEGIYLNKYFNFHVYLSFRPFVHPPSVIRLCVWKLSSIPASLLQNVTSKLFSICYESE